MFLALSMFLSSILPTISLLPASVFNLKESKFKAFADEKINVNEILKLGLKRVENIVGKGEKADYQGHQISRLYGTDTGILCTYYHRIVSNLTSLSEKALLNLKKKNDVGSFET